MAIDRDTPVNSAFIRVIDREMISQSVFPTHQASIFPAKSTHVVKMVARIEAGAAVSKWEKRKTLKLAIKWNFLYSEARTLLLQIEGYRRRLCITNLITNTLTLSMAAFIRARILCSSFLDKDKPQSTEIRAIQN